MSLSPPSTGSENGSFDESSPNGYNKLELDEVFNQIDKNGTGFIDVSNLKSALDLCGFKVPAWQVRHIADEFSKQGQTAGGKFSFTEFEQCCNALKSQEVATTFKSMVHRRENLETLGGMSHASSEGTTHTVRLEEQVAFSDWINRNLSVDPDLKHILPIDTLGRDLYEKVQDGILLCKIINHSCPETVDERAINKKSMTVYRKHENLTLALTSAQSIGCNVVNIDAQALYKGIPYLVLGLIWQIIRIGLFNQISLANCPELAAVLQPGEKIEDLMKISPESTLLRWVNYHLEQAGIKRRCNNFTTDIRDSEIYTHLIKQIAPAEKRVNTEALRENDLLQRAEVMLKQADKLGCRSFVTPTDVVEGAYRLNLAFVANLFNNYPALDGANIGSGDFGMIIEETREEKTYRNWMNSLGVTPFVNWIYSDLADGLILFQLYDVIRPDLVNWKRVHKKFSQLKKFMEKLENCNYAVDLGKQLKFSLVGIAGQDLAEGNQTLTLALIWQLMKAYTLSVLTGLAQTGNPIVEKEIIIWVNNKLKQKGISISGFQDQAIATGKPVIDLIDVIKPGTINYSVVKEGGNSQDNLENAKYAISMARKIGANVYALPEDIAEVKYKMVMTVFACLMAVDYIPNMDSAVDQNTGYDKANGNGAN